MIIVKTTPVILLLLSFIWGQDQISIESLSIDYKQNGLFLTLKASRPIPKNNITGWLNEDWFYMTIHDAKSDSVSLTETQFQDPILSLQNTNAKESTQLAIRIKGNIERFEFYIADDSKEILTALYFPQEMAVAFLENKKAVTNKPAYTPLSRITTVLYFAGTSLTISGIIANDGGDSGKTELSLGIIILAGTYIFNKLVESFDKPSMKKKELKICLFQAENSVSVINSKAMGNFSNEKQVYFNLFNLCHRFVKGF